MSEQAKQALLSMDSFSISVFRVFGPRWVRRVFLGRQQEPPQSSCWRTGGNPFAPHSHDPSLRTTHQNIKEVILGSAGK